jgi:hypothetical protein
MSRANDAELHTDDYVAMSISSEPRLLAEKPQQNHSVRLANVTTVHHSHTPVIDFQDWDNATGVWTMEDNLFWMRKLQRLHAETSPGAVIMAADFSGENPLVGIG